MRDSQHYLLAAVLLALAGLGCEPQQGAVPRSAGHIALVAPGRDDPLWPVFEACAERFQRIHRRVEVRTLAPERRSAADQVELIRSLSEKGLRAVCVQPADVRALSDPLQTLRLGGIPVVTLLHEVPAKTPFLHSGVDERQVGVALADTLAALLPDGGTVGAVTASDDEAATLRWREFTRRMESHSGLTLLLDFDCNGQPDCTFERMRESSERFPGLAGWATMTRWTTPLVPPGPAVPPTDCLVVPGPLDNLEGFFVGGSCRAVILTDYARVITKGLELCLIVADSHPPQLRRYDTPLITVTPRNVEEYWERVRRWTSVDAGPPDDEPYAD